MFRIAMTHYYWCTSEDPVAENPGSPMNMSGPEASPVGTIPTSESLSASLTINQTQHNRSRPSYSWLFGPWREEMLCLIVRLAKQLLSSSQRSKSCPRGQSQVCLWRQQVRPRGLTYSVGEPGFSSNWIHGRTKIIWSISLPLALSSLGIHLSPLLW